MVEWFCLLGILFNKKIISDSNTGSVNNSEIISRNCYSSNLNMSILHKKMDIQNYLQK